MNNAVSSRTITSRQVLRRSLLFIHLFWFCLMLLLMAWNVWRDQIQREQLVRREALIRLQTANNIRRWIVGFGGVYAPMSETHQPNPYIPPSVERDIETTSGAKLTIANSISALNHIIGKDNRVEGGYVRFTGPDPLKSANSPDAWEQAALQRLRNGEPLVGGYTNLEGRPYYRLLQPLTLKPKCYKCHRYETFRVGDIVGGLGVNVDLAVYASLRRDAIASHIVNYLGIWFIGVLGISFTGWKWRGFLREKDEHNRRLQDLATHDPLTGLLNRHQIDVIFEKELARSHRNQTSLSILMVDIDKFKAINDAYGHPTGDQVLSRIGQLVGQYSRASDYVIRYGGDELLFLLPECNHTEALLKAESLTRLVSAQPLVIEKGVSLQVTFSIGVASCPEHGTQSPALIQAADAAVYQAKATGRNRVCSAHPDASSKPGSECSRHA